MLLLVGTRISVQLVSLQLFFMTMELSLLYCITDTVCYSKRYPDGIIETEQNPDVGTRLHVIDIK